MATKKKGPEADSTAKDKGADFEEGGQAAKPANAKADGPRKGEPKKGADKGKAKPAKEAPRDGNKGKKKDDDSEIGESIKDVRQFLKEVAIEFRKITWPGRQQVIQETYSVLFLVTVITLMVLAFDWAVGKAIFGPLEDFAHKHGSTFGRASSS